MMSQAYAVDLGGLSAFAHLKSDRLVWMVVLDAGGDVAASRVRALFSQNLSRFLHIEKMHGRDAKTVAEDLGVTPNLLSLWRRGLSFPRAEQIDKLAEVLGVKPESFFRENVVTGGQDLEDALFELARSLGYEVIKPGKS